MVRSPCLVACLSVLWPYNDGAFNVMHSDLHTIAALTGDRADS